MYLFDDSVTLWISDCGGDWLNTIAFQHLLKLLTDKFISIIVYNSGRPWITAQPFTVEEEGDVVAGLVTDGDEFWPTGGFVNDGESLDLFNGSFAGDGG